MQPDLLAVIEIVTFERRWDGSFQLLNDAPAWFRTLFPVGAADVTEVFPFLESFLPDCEEFWLKGEGHGSLESDIWTQADSCGDEFHLQCTAYSAGIRKLIVIARANRRYEERRLLQQHAHDVELLTHKLDVAVRAKAEKISTLGHEIRTPLNAILGYAELLASTRLDREQREYVELFQAAGENLLTLVNDSLNMGEIEADRQIAQQVEFSLDEVIEKALETMALRAYSKGLELIGWADEDVPRLVAGDPQRLRQVLFNVLGNAVKFTGAGEVVLRVRLRGKGELMFSVQDSGMGIPSEKHAAIFEDSVRGDSSVARRFGGMGLGLGIARRLVNSMGGRIWVESEAGKGSTFFFTVRMETAVRDAVREPMELNGLKVLVRDGCAANVEYLSRFLLARGGQVVEDSAEPHDLALIDVRKLDTAANHAIPLLLPHRRAPDQSRCRALGLSRWIVKPLRGSEISRVLRAVISGAPSTPMQVISITAPALAGYRILLADDSTESAELMRSYLKPTGCVLDIAVNGAAAIDRFETMTFDAVLMDLRMPVMDGFEAIRGIREWEQRMRRPATPVIAMTAASGSGHVERATLAGATYVLTKPVRQTELFEALAANLRQSAVSGSTAERAMSSLASIIPWYLNTWRGRIAELREQAEKGEFEALRIRGHNLRGTGAGYGFPKLSALGERLETAAMERDSKKAGRAVDELESQLGAIGVAAPGA